MHAACRILRCFDMKLSTIINAQFFIFICITISLLKRILSFIEFTTNSLLFNVPFRNFIFVIKSFRFYSYSKCKFTADLIAAFLMRF